MKKILLGGGITALVLVLGLVVWQEYRHFKALVETHMWIHQLNPFLQTIAERAVEEGTLEEMALDMSPAGLQLDNVEEFRVSRDSLVIVKGGMAGQMITLVPKLEQGVVEWRCVGTPDYAMPMPCRTYEVLRLGQLLDKEGNPIILEER